MSSINEYIILNISHGIFVLVDDHRVSSYLLAIDEGTIIETNSFPFPLQPFLVKKLYKLGRRKRDEE